MKQSFYSRLAALLLPALAFLCTALSVQAQDDSTIRGELDPDTGYVTDQNGYRYQYVEGLKLELCAGGNYSGTVYLPQTLLVGGKELEVAGIAANAFRDNKDVTDVIWDQNTQYVGPSAFYRSGVYYYWQSRYGIPGYVYPSEDFSVFVLQDKVEEFDRTTPRWVFFKHNYAPVTFKKDRMEDESAQWGYSPWRAEDMQGVYFEMNAPDSVKRSMFRGYEAMEVVGVLMEGRFAAFHRFPPFSRWKWGEKEQSMSASLEQQMATRYGRTLLRSRYIGNLREEDGRIGIFEFEPKDGEAMIVIAWVVGGKIKATYVQTTNIDPREGEYSVWNVDDDGEYGIPDLLCVAFDLHDNVILFFNHNAPESVNLFGLRQQGDQLQLFGEDQWYRYVD